MLVNTNLNVFTSKAMLLQWDDILSFLKLCNLLKLIIKAFVQALESATP